MRGGCSGAPVRFLEANATYGRNAVSAGHSISRLRVKMGRTERRPVLSERRAVGGSPGDQLLLAQIEFRRRVEDQRIAALLIRRDLHPRGGKWRQRDVA
jgi:hypothetical protein